MFPTNGVEKIARKCSNLILHKEDRVLHRKFKKWKKSHEKHTVASHFFCTSHQGLTLVVGTPAQHMSKTCTCTCVKSLEVKILELSAEENYLESLVKWLLDHLHLLGSSEPSTSMSGSGGWIHGTVSTWFQYDRVLKFQSDLFEKLQFTNIDRVNPFLTSVSDFYCWC